MARNLDLSSQLDTARRRTALYWGVGIGLGALLLLSRGSTWQGSAELHTIMEALATLLATMVGVMALLRYYTRPDNLFLFVGAGFLGTAFLDGFHGVVTSEFFRPYMPSDLPSLAPWSWVASRQFLSIIMVLSLVAWYREARLGQAGRVSASTVYFGTAIFTLLSFLFFTFFPLPRAYYPEYVFHRPEEILPALFFLIALAGYLVKGQWRHGYFEHWLVLSLIVGFVSQAAFMSLSGHLFDFDFDLAHLLKKASYICVLTGLLASMYQIFRREIRNTQSLAESENRVRAIVDNIFDGVVTINEKGIIQSANPATETIFGYPIHDLIGQNVRMLMPESVQAHHDKYIQEYSLSGDAKIIGQGRTVNGRRADGGIFPINLEIAELPLDGEKLFLGVVRDITEHQKADRMKNEFVSTVSHELRTPLTSIKGSLGLIQSGSLGDVPIKISSLIDIAYRNSDRLVILINDILDMEKIAAGKMDFELDRMDLVDLVRQAIDANAGYADEHDVRYTLKNAPTTAPVRGDKNRLMQVMYNLLSNAAKFSPAGGSVEISLTAADGVFRVSVRDYGPGIPLEFQSRIFGKFAQADSSDTRQASGTGLGLSIAKAIVENHNGTIGFETAEGLGTTFYYDIPAMADQPPVALTQNDAVTQNTEQAGAQVLICENDADNAALLASLVHKQGYGTSIVTSAEQANYVLKENIFDVVTVDIDLPGQDGISFIRTLRDNERTRHLPVVVVSISAAEGKKGLNGNDLNVAGWVNKPIITEELTEAMQRALKTDKPSQILYVEDDLDLGEALADLMEDSAEVVQVRSVAEAKEKLITDNYSLIVLDITLPDGNGHEIIPSLAASKNSATPIIVYSGQDDVHDMPDEIRAVLKKSKTSNETLLHVINSHMQHEVEYESALSA